MLKPSGELVIKPQKCNCPVIMAGTFKGWIGEKLTTFGMWLRLDATTYRRVQASRTSSRPRAAPQNLLNKCRVEAVFMSRTKNGPALFGFSGHVQKNDNCMRTIGRKPGFWDF